MQGGLTCHEQLLLDIYSRIGEPDGIYAVARSHNLLSQLHVFEHEGSWHNALAVQDILSRQTSFAGGGPDSGARVRPQELACAQSLGCQHLIACVTQGSDVSGGSGGLVCTSVSSSRPARAPAAPACYSPGLESMRDTAVLLPFLVCVSQAADTSLCSLVPTNTFCATGNPAMAELQQEVAWRMGSWQPLEDQGPSSVPAMQDVGINSAIRAGVQVRVPVTWAQPGCNKGALLPALDPRGHATCWRARTVMRPDACMQHTIVLAMPWTPGSTS